jgi:hypothetical protein
MSGDRYAATYFNERQESQLTPALVSRHACPHAGQRSRFARAAGAGCLSRFEPGVELCGDDALTMGPCGLG